MKLHPQAYAAVVLLLIMTTWPAFAQKTCQIDSFRGATLPQGTSTKMHVINNGSACVMANYGEAADKTGAADSGSITKQPMHGKAEFVPPEARYTPEPGYVGDDEFDYEAFARSRTQQVRLKLHVNVVVTAP
ncbi:Ig-like domain-containing protein [Variovorax sp. dw_954]|uniref:Ig-like domain-containing protein n=1 Tax=Variovorax sp. dw_954 TaxID=2720078 RepID=UPI001BD2FC34|nr:Ig-like domain-containing protein [Variovorax sp. dw_954]